MVSYLEINDTFSFTIYKIFKILFDSKKLMIKKYIFIRRQIYSECYQIAPTSVYLFADGPNDTFGTWRNSE